MSRLSNVSNSDLTLAGELQMQIDDVNPAHAGTQIVVRIVETRAEGLIQGTFDVVPPGSAAAPAHVGFGVFHKGLTYINAFPPTSPPNHFHVDATLYIADGGDANGDGQVGYQDIANLIDRFTQADDPPDRTWTDGDTAGGPIGRGDGNVDIQDVNDLLANFTVDPGPADPGTATAEYNYVTNEWTVSVDSVMSWALISEGQFLQSAAPGVYDALPAGGAGNLASANDNTIGEGNFDGPMTYANVRLGQLTEPDVAVDRIRLQYVNGFGGQKLVGTISVVPEPGSITLLVCGAVAGLIWWRRRR